MHPVCAFVEAAKRVLPFIMYTWVAFSREANATSEWMCDLDPSAKTAFLRAPNLYMHAAPCRVLLQIPSIVLVWATLEHTSH